MFHASIAQLVTAAIRLAAVPLVAVITVVGLLTVSLSATHEASANHIGYWQGDCYIMRDDTTGRDLTYGCFWSSNRRFFLVYHGTVTPGYGLPNGLLWYGGDRSYNFNDWYYRAGDGAWVHVAQFSSSNAARDAAQCLFYRIVYPSYTRCNPAKQQ